MYFTASLIALSASSLGLVAAAPAASALLRRNNFGSCSTPVNGLSATDCQHLQSIGFAQQGVNAHSSANSAKSPIWIGGDGPNTFSFYNKAGVEVTLVAWDMPGGDYAALFMNARQAKVTYSIPAGQNVTLSLANDVSGGFAGVYNQLTGLTQYGLVDNVWGEFTTGPEATIDVSREVNMGGNHMSIQVKNSGCVSEWTPTSSRCSFKCASGNTCKNDYILDNCANGSQPGASFGLFLGLPSGGCQGFPNGGHVDVTFLE